MPQRMNEYHHIYSCSFIFLELLVVLTFLSLSLLWIAIIMIIATLVFIRPHYIRLKNGKKSRFQEWLDELISNDLSDYEIFIRTFPIIITLILATSLDRVKYNTQLFFANLKEWENFASTDVDWGLTTFWILLVSWLWLFPISLSAMSIANGRKLKKILSSIHRAPSDEIFVSYPRFYSNMIDALKIAKDLRNEDEEQKVIEYEIEIILRTITEIVKYFSPYKDEKEKIGANIWLLLNKIDNTDIISQLPNTLDFKTVHRSEDVSGVAILLKNLILDLKESTNFDIVRYLALPIPNNANVKDEMKALPGVPYAALEGFSIVNDINALESDLKDFGSEIRGSIVEYFKNGNGKGINSFASFRIGDNVNPIGVLNLDSNMDNIMGDENFIYTFFALLEPIKKELDDRIIRFLELFRESEDFPWK